MTMPDEDLEPLEPPEVIVGIPHRVIAEGRAVIAMPSINPALSPTLDVVGLPELGWHIRIKDAFGTILWSVLVKGLEDE